MRRAFDSAEKEWITPKQWESYARRVEKKRLKEAGKSMTAGSIARQANHCICEVQANLMIVRKGWRQAMETAA